MNCAEKLLEPSIVFNLLKKVTILTYCNETKNMALNSEAVRAKVKP